MCRKSVSQFIKRKFTDGLFECAYIQSNCCEFYSSSLPLWKLKITNVVIQLEKSEHPRKSRIQVLISIVIEGIITCELAQLLGKQQNIQILTSGDRPGFKTSKNGLVLLDRISASFVATHRRVGKLAFPSVSILCEMVDYVADT